MGSIGYLLVILKGYTVALMDLCFQQYVCIKKGAVRLMLEKLSKRDFKTCIV